MEKLVNQDLFYVLRRLPKDVLMLLQEYKGRVFIAGGYIRACVAGEKPRDIDLFCDDKVLAKELAYRLKNNDRLVETDFAYTICRRLSIQLIHRWVYDNPVQLVDEFDFTIVQAAIWHDKSSTSWLSYCSKNFYSDLAAKRLVYTCPVRDEEPGGSIIRVLKYISKGYRIPLDSFGQVIARLYVGVKEDELPPRTEATRTEVLGTVLTALMFEVDPAADFESQGFLKRFIGVTDK